MKILRNTIEVDDRKISHFNYNECETFFPHYANNELIQFRNVFPTFIVSQYDYIYDAAGRRSERYHSGSAFATPDQIYYDHNDRSELTNAVASVDASYNFAYNYDDIGNRMWSVENMNETAYTANNLNQYTAIEEAADTFVPQFDADGNQTLIKTATGIWQVTYNGENRPVYWSNSTTNIVMSFDRMGRRVQYLETAGATTNANNTFTYDNYLCIARHREQDDGTAVTDRFIWDPTEPVATRPLVFNYATAPSAYYTHDGNKNVSELVDGSEDVVAHYEYEAFGAICVETGDWGEENPWRFSSEYGDSVLGLVYYNYRHYEPVMGRWLTRDPIGEIGSAGLYVMLSNSSKIDFLGLLNWSLFTEGAFQFFTSALATTITIAVVATGVAVAPATGGTSLAVAVAAASAIGTVAWNGMNIGNGIVKIVKATQDEQNYDDMQLQCLYWTIEKIDGDPLSEKGLLYTRIGYTAFDMLVGSKSVKVNAKELYQETVKIICRPQKQMILEGPLKYLEVHTFSHEISIRIDVTDVIDLLDVGAEGGGVLLDGMQLKEDVNKLIDAYSPQTE